MTKSSPPPVERAFTLIELLVVMATIGILLAIAVPALSSAYERAKVTKDLSDLRQIGAATQMYMNDNNGVLFSATGGSWMSQLYKIDNLGNSIASTYISSWNIFVSPFDHPVSPRTVSSKSATSALSYGINGTTGVIGMSADRISKPTVFIVFAPAQASGSKVTFAGFANTTSQVTLAASANVTVVGIGGGRATSVPGGNATGGTSNSRAKINALCADWHVETMPWSGTGPAFTNTATTATDPDGAYRWNP
jgi:prepilin-type N-terminal cleavage/methylation domain-containing protein